MSTPAELNLYGLWAGKQTAKGTPQVTPTHRMIQVAGDFNAPRQDGREEWSDLSQFGAVTDWADQLVGNGAPGIEATPEELACLLWLFHGAESTSAITGPPAKTKHTFTPTAGLGFWSTWFKRLGLSQIQRHQYNDCQISQLMIEGSTAAKAIRATPTIVSLDPAQIYAADPTQAVPSKAPFLFTDGMGTFTIDGSVFRGASQFALTLNLNLSPVFSDDITAYDLIRADTNVTLGITNFFDADGLAQFNKLLYGTAAPAAGTKPLHRLPAMGSYSFDLTRAAAASPNAGDEFSLSLPVVKWALPDSPGPNPAGGPAEIALAGELRQSATPYTLFVSCDAAAFTT